MYILMYLSKPRLFKSAINLACWLVENRVTGTSYEVWYDKDMTGLDFINITQEFKTKVL